MALRNPKDRNRKCDEPRHIVVSMRTNTGHETGLPESASEKITGPTAGNRGGHSSPSPEVCFREGAKAGWWKKAVQLDLEATGSVAREDSKPLRWHKS